MVMTVENIIKSRFSARAFKKDPVSRELILEILSIASYAPSGTNIQPWKVYVLAGQKLTDLKLKICDLYDQLIQDSILSQQYKEIYPYYPKEWFSPYIERRRATGFGLYDILGIKKEDKEKRIEQEKRNFLFFDAPVGIFFTLDKRLGDGAKMDTAMFMQNMMLMAKEKGLDTCAQAAWNKFHQLILPMIGAAENEYLLSAMALGYADIDQVVNTFRTERVPAIEFTTFVFDEEK